MLKLTELNTIKKTYNVKVNNTTKQHDCLIKPGLCASRNHTKLMEKECY